MSTPWAIVGQTGLVNRIFTGTEADAELQCSPEEVAVDASALSSALPDWEDQLASGRSLVFQVGMFFIQDLRTLESVRAAKRAEIDSSRLAANQATFQIGNQLFRVDPLSRSDIDGVSDYVSLFGTLPPNWPGGWKDTEGGLYPITTVAQWQTFVQAMVVQGVEHFLHAESLKNAVAQAATNAEVEAISW
jgi:hypothetical protein